MSLYAEDTYILRICHVDACYFPSFSTPRISRHSYSYIVAMSQSFSTPSQLQSEQENSSKSVVDSFSLFIA